ncbi:PKD domain-containing protein [Salipiger mangrovisoli]|uniref:Right-handed parallel beta-helix repeat-containing protein n=1 Tax=Salipiger mangrovisoli TaxID=2865933 RepID=A0ABR9XA92_9RHOB|nr:right-handed parallel beta-helix repeat-containing protein [Salipiger mangrovisoli]MBE9640433.1 right-handed parallel beta-helix repeat-containing protein [Salipiger mangrovisoli]
MATTEGVSGTMIVSSQAEFEAAYRALSTGVGGQILLRSGEEYSLSIRDVGDVVESAAVTIGSLDPSDPALIKSVQMSGAENITFENLRFNVSGQEVSGSGYLVNISNSQNITFRNSVLSSDAEGPLGTTDDFAEGAMLALVRNCDGIAFEDNEVYGFDHGFAFLDSYNVSLVGNDIHSLQGDGIRIGGVSGMLIEGNHLHDFLGATQSANHSDMIQLWGTRINVNNEDIVIRENFLDTGNGANYQMIFGRNEAFDDNGFLYKGIVVEHNLLYGANFHSISIVDTSGMIVRNNTVLYNPDAYNIFADGSETQSLATGMIRVGGEGAIIEDNVAHAITGGGVNYVLGAASTLQDNDYRAHFVNVEAGGDGDLRDLMLRPDSPLNGVAGSRLTWATDTAEELTAVADVTVSQADKSLVTLDAGWSRGPDGYVAPLGASFSWSFDDGSKAEGVSVTHDFGGSGRHGYTLTVTAADGSQDVIARSIEIEEVAVFDLSFAEGAVQDDAGTGALIQLKDAVVLDDGWLEVGGRERLEVTRSTEGLFNLSSFNFGLTVDRAEGASGVLVDFPGTFEARIDAMGRVEFCLETDEGSFLITSAAEIFADNAPHRLNFVFDGAAGTLSIEVDGELDSQIEAHGITAPKQSWGLTIGNTWHDGVDARVQTIALYTEAEPDALNPEPDPAVELVPEPGIPDVIGSLAFEGGEAQGEGIFYSLDEPGAITDAGVDLALGTLTLTRKNAVLYEAESFGLSFDLTLKPGDSAGTVAYLHNTLEVDLDTAGQLVLRLNTENGWKQIGSVGLELDDGAAHNVSIQYDSDAGLMQLVVDGEVAASGSQTGATPQVKYWGLSFGHPWQEQDAGVYVDNISISDQGHTVQFAAVEALQAETADTVALLLDFEGSIIADKSGSGATVSTTDDLISIEEHADGSQFVDISRGGAVHVARTYDALFGQDSFVFDFTMRSDTASGRNVFGIRNSFQLDVDQDDLVFKITTNQGNFSVATEGDILADHDWHRVEIAYSEAVGLLQMRVDGEVAAQAEVSGTTLERQYWGLDLGNIWSGGFDGAIDDFAYATDVDRQLFHLG